MQYSEIQDRLAFAPSEAPRFHKTTLKAGCAQRPHRRVSAALSRSCILLSFAPLVVMASMSTSAEAGLLKGGLEVGDRSRIHIAAVPGPGEPRFVPRAEPEVVPSHVELGVARKSDPDAETGPAPSARGSARGDAPETRPAKPAPDLRELLRHILEQFPNEIAAAAEKHKVSEALILAVIAIESAGRPHVRSHAGAEGLMQLIPATAKRFGITDSFDPSQNIDAGAAYLSWLLKTFNGNLPLVLAGYNAGEGAVRKYGGVPPYRETRDYVTKVTHAVAGAEEICRAVPNQSPGSCARPAKRA